MTRLNPDYRRIAERLLLNAELPVSLTSALAKALRSGKPRMTRPAEVIIEENSKGGVLHVVSRGTVQVHVTNIDGDSVKVAELKGPVVVGYLAALDGGVRTARCTVERTSLVIDFSKKQIQTLLSRADPAAEAFRTLLLRAMTAQIASTSKQLATLRSTRS